MIPIQSGKAYIVMIIAESGKANLLSPLEKDSTYQLSCSLSLETFRGMGTQPARIAFKFNNGDNPWTSPYITTTQWQHFDTVFKASDNATEIEISGIDTVLSGTKIDNVSLVKLTGTSIGDYFLTKKKIKIYPNPTTGILLIDGANNAGIKIYNSIGQQINYISNKEKNSLQFDLTHLSKGLYFIQIKTKQEIIIEKILLIN